MTFRFESFVHITNKHTMNTPKGGRAGIDFVVRKIYRETYDSQFFQFTASFTLLTQTFFNGTDDGKHLYAQHDWNVLYVEVSSIDFCSFFFFCTVRDN